jgi:predicted nucleic acid-binding protein
MRAILDASTAVKAVLVEADSDKAIRLLEEFRRGVHQLLAPEVFLAEIGHALTRAERKKIIPVGDAAVYFDALVTPPPELRSIAPLIGRAVELSSRTRTPLYDCLYYLLAVDEKCDVITADEKFLKAFESTGRVVSLSTLP